MGEVRAAPLSQLPELAPLALASATEDRKTIVLSVLADLLRRTSGSDLFLAELTEAGERIGAAVAIRTAADSASLLAVGTLPGLTPAGETAVFHQLLGHLHWRLADAGVTFVQAMREAEIEQPRLVDCGYEFLATLDYLVATRRASALAAGAVSGLRGIPYEDFFRSPAVRDGFTPREGLVALIEATYVDSLDCPRMERFRSAAAMVDTYRGSPAYDPVDWQVLVDGRQRALGCLLATPHLASGSLEITYMGLVPEARGQGHAAAILEQAWETADRHALPQLTLAVDRANRPALKLYQRHGFEALMSETVWGRSLKSEQETSAGGKTLPSGNAKEPT